MDNTTDEDWKNVKLSVVSGRPISFISLLDTPRYGQRQIAELPEDRAAGPVVYGGTVDMFKPGAGLTLGSGSGDGYGPGAGGGTGGGSYRIANKGVPESMNQSIQLEQEAKLLPSSVEGATGATLGELFEYRFRQPGHDQEEPIRHAPVPAG